MAEYTEATGNSDDADRAEYKIMRGERGKVTAAEWDAYRARHTSSYDKNAGQYQAYDTTPF